MPGVQDRLPDLQIESAAAAAGNPIGDGAKGEAFLPQPGPRAAESFATHQTMSWISLISCSLMTNSSKRVLVAFRSWIVPHRGSPARCPRFVRSRPIPERFCRPDTTRNADLYQRTTPSATGRRSSCHPSPYSIYDDGSASVTSTDVPDGPVIQKRVPQSLHAVSAWTHARITGPTKPPDLNRQTGR